MREREIWLRDAVAELLQVDASEVAVTQSFAELGMDSVAGLRLTRRLQDLLEEEVELEWLFDHPTIRELAVFLDAHFGEFNAVAAQDRQA